VFAAPAQVADGIEAGGGVAQRIQRHMGAAVGDVGVVPDPAMPIAFMGTPCVPVAGFAANLIAKDLYSTGATGRFYKNSIR
jgi:hypothetical protein